MEFSPTDSVIASILLGFISFHKHLHCKVVVPFGISRIFFFLFLPTLWEKSPEGDTCMATPFHHPWMNLVCRQESKWGTTPLGSIKWHFYILEKFQPKIKYQFCLGWWRSIFDKLVVIRPEWTNNTHEQILIHWQLLMTHLSMNWVDIDWTSLPFMASWYYTMHVIVTTTYYIGKVINR